MPVTFSVQSNFLALVRRARGSNLRRLHARYSAACLYFLQANGRDSGRWWVYCCLERLHVLSESHASRVISIATCWRLRRQLQYLSLLHRHGEDYVVKEANVTVHGEFFQSLGSWDIRLAILVILRQRSLQHTQVPDRLVNILTSSIELWLELLVGKSLLERFLIGQSHT